MAEQGIWDFERASRYVKCVTRWPWKQCSALHRFYHPHGTCGVEDLCDVCAYNRDKERGERRWARLEGITSILSGVVTYHTSWRHRIRSQEDLAILDEIVWNVMREAILDHLREKWPDWFDAEYGLFDPDVELGIYIDWDTSGDESPFVFHSHQNVTIPGLACRRWTGGRVEWREFGPRLPAHTLDRIKDDLAACFSVFFDLPFPLIRKNINYRHLPRGQGEGSQRKGKAQRRHWAKYSTMHVVDDETFKRYIGNPRRLNLRSTSESRSCGRRGWRLAAKKRQPATASPSRGRAAGDVLNHRNSGRYSGTRRPYKAEPLLGKRRIGEPELDRLILDPRIWHLSRRGITRGWVKSTKGWRWDHKFDSMKKEGVWHGADMVLDPILHEELREIRDAMRAGFEERPDDGSTRADILLAAQTMLESTDSQLRDQVGYNREDGRTVREILGDGPPTDKDLGRLWAILGKYKNTQLEELGFRWSSFSPPEGADYPEEGSWEGEDNTRVMQRCPACKRFGLDRGVS